MAIRIVNWDKFQHYKERRPTWVKLYRDLLDKREWRELSGDASKLLADCWLLASEADEPGTIDMDPKDLAWRLRSDVDNLLECLQELVAARFIEMDAVLASKVLATRYQVASPETETETETEKSTTAADAAFEELRKAYPQRQGGNPWPRARKCWNARRREGVSAEQMLDGVKRYSAYLKAAGKIGTEYVKQASTFLGPDQHWKEDWALPAPAGSTVPNHIDPISGKPYQEGQLDVAGTHRWFKGQWVPAVRKYVQDIGPPGSLESIGSLLGPLLKVVP